MNIFASLTQPKTRYLFFIFKGKPNINILIFSLILFYKKLAPLFTKEEYM